MKSNIFIKVLDEATIEVDVNYNDMLYRLRCLQGWCRDIDEISASLAFLCNKWGRMRVDNIPNRTRRDSDNLFVRRYYVKGRVINKNGKTVIKIYSVHNRLREFSSYFVFLLTLLILAVFGVLKLYTMQPFSYREIILAGLLLTASLIPIFITTHEDDNYVEILEKLKNEMLKRIEAARRWND